jgi:hypothetical protein
VSKPAKRDKKKKVLSIEDKKVDELHMMTKCPKQLGRLPREENH